MNRKEVKSWTSQGTLSPVYKFYVAFECILINLVGFVTLFFQCQLQDLENQAKEAYPNANLTDTEWDSIFGHYWLKGDLNCSTRQAHALTYMVSGWLMIAGILQLFINFDDLRQSIFPASNGFVVLPKSIKIICMYIFFVCDWYWVALMYSYSDVIGWQQIIGSLFDIALRLPFVTNPSFMFQNDDETAKGREEYTQLHNEELGCWSEAPPIYTEKSSYSNKS